MHAAPPFDQATIPYVGGPRRAFVSSVHDGDTFWCTVDLGFGDHHSNPEKGSRLVGPNAQGFNTPELNAADPDVRQRARDALARVAELILGKFVFVESWPPTTDDKYGRWLMAVYVLSAGSAVTPAVPVSVNTGPAGVTGPLVPCFDLASQLVAEGLGEWREF